MARGSITSSVICTSPSVKCRKQPPLTVPRFLLLQNSTGQQGNISSPAFVVPPGQVPAARGGSPSMVSAEAHHPAFQCPVYDVFPFMQNRQAVISPSESHKGFPPCLPCCLKIPFSDELTDRYPVPYAGLSHFHLVIVDTKLHLCRKQDAPEGYTFPKG